MQSPKGVADSTFSRVMNLINTIWARPTRRSIACASSSEPPLVNRSHLPMSRVAMLSVHGCPLARLGTREAGGMQLYVRALSRELGRRGVGVDVYTRRVDPALPTVVPFGSNARVIHLDAGEKSQVDKSTVFDLLPEFVCNLQRFRRAEGIDYDYIHSHYWLSGWVGNLLAPRWNVPHIAMFHTLGRLKNRALGENTESEARSDVEARIVA